MFPLSTAVETARGASRKAGGGGDFGLRLGDLQRQDGDLDRGEDDHGLSEGWEEKTGHVAHNDETT